MTGVRKSRSKIVFDILNHAILISFGLVMIIPIVFILIKSFSPMDLYMKRQLIIPLNRLTLVSYKYIFATPVIPRAYRVTAFVTIVGTLLNLMVTSLTAYAISKKFLPGRKTFMILILIIMYFSGGLIPTYLLVKNVGLVNSLWALILPEVMSPWYMIIMRTFFEKLPPALEESAVIDGCTPIGVFMRIILPLSKAALASIGLFYAVVHWNSFFNCIIYILDQSKWTLQVVLRQIVISDDMAALAIESLDTPPMETVKYAAIIATTAPIIFVYPFLQKYFVKGVMLGSVKG